MTGFAMNDVMLLCGNGSGIGAMKIVRGMFETSTLAEYLRRNPNEILDYVDFGAVLAWRRLHTLKGEKRDSLTPEQVKQLEDEYDSVKTRFTTNDRERNNWTTKSLRKMAEELGRSESYNLVYGLACSLHHANFEGLMGYHEMKDGKLEMMGPPSFAWIGAALVAAHENLWRALKTLNDCGKLGFDPKLKPQVRNSTISGRTDDAPTARHSSRSLQDTPLRRVWESREKAEQVTDQETRPNSGRKSTASVCQANSNPTQLTRSI
jgi:hypothetical protein